MGRFDGKVVLVTGGSSGLGLASAELFIGEGALVYIVDLDERGVLTKLGPNARFRKCDVSSPEDCETAIVACLATYGRLDVLFHNAGIIHPLSKVAELPVATFRRVTEIDLNSLFYLARVAIPQFKRQGKGNIVTTASTSGIRGDRGLCAYGAAKAGVINLTRIMALDHAEDGIRVNCVCPGNMVTPMTEGFRQNLGAHEALVNSIPMKRGGDPFEVAKVVLFVASDEASYMTGQGRN
ncbi:hypothetical protein AYO22_11673 [Fonsecaea multimorphosa]|nr:hypothetical protein AYO22_11673 [Fonsecaea multimorphosa]